MLGLACVSPAPSLVVLQVAFDRIAGTCIGGTLGYVAWSLAMQVTHEDNAFAGVLVAIGCAVLVAASTYGAAVYQQDQARACREPTYVFRLSPSAFVFILY
jgi:uncharacterized membrane protein YccC